MRKRQTTDHVLSDYQKIAPLERGANPFDDLCQHTMTHGDGEFLLFYAPPLFRSGTFRVLSGWLLCVMDAAACVGTDFHDLSTVAAVRHDGIAHLLARLLRWT